MKNTAACKPFRRYFFRIAYRGCADLYNRPFLSGGFAGLLRVSRVFRTIIRALRYFPSGRPSGVPAATQFPFSSQQAHPLMQPPLLTLRTTLTAIAATMTASAAATIIVPAFSIKNPIMLRRR
jgi:hypothetical protein